MKESVFSYLRRLNKNDIFTHLYKSDSESSEIASRYILEGLNLGHQTIYISDKDIPDEVILRLHNNNMGIDSETIAKNTRSIKVSDPGHGGVFMYSSFLKQARETIGSVSARNNPLSRFIIHKVPSFLDNTNSFDIMEAAKINSICGKLPIVLLYQFQLNSINSEDLLNILKVSPRIVENDYVYESDFFVNPSEIPESDKPESKINDLLTQQEKNVLRGIVNGLSNKTIAENLSLSPRTVESHRARIMKKLEVNSLVDLVKFAIKNGFI